MSGITVKHGTEGPRHDPYSYTELTVQRDGKASVKIHYGLGDWMRIGDGLKMHSDSHKQNIFNAFETLTGFSVKQAERILRKLEESRYRAHKAHGGFKWSNGYPGEELCFCKCGNVIDSFFDERAII